MHNKFNFTFSLPTSIYFGEEVVSKNSALFNIGKRAYIVTGKTSGRLSGALHDVMKALAKHSIEFLVFEGIGNNPEVEQCITIGKEARDFGADMIIGIGGGSPLDASKAIAVFGANDITCDRLYQYGYPNGVLPIIAIPTTSGTGSEVTPWSVLTRHDKRTKCSFGGPLTFPKYALLDPKYTASLPAAVTMDTAMDAFTHCLESIISIKATPMTDAINLYALRLFSNCMCALESGEFDGIREDLMLVSLLGGSTIAMTGTTIMHALGYPLTYFHGVTHGAANSYVLPVYLNSIKEHRYDRLMLTLKALDMDFDALINFAKRNYKFNINLTPEMIALYAQQTALQNSAKNTGIPCEIADIENMYRSIAL